jgi:hypothetical protein
MPAGDQHLAIDAIGLPVGDRLAAFRAANFDLRLSNRATNKKVDRP